MDSFIDRVVSYVRHRWHQRVRPAPADEASLFALLSLLRPVRARDQRKIRVGSNRDGGYVMLDDFQKIDAALSLGVGPEVSWDFDVAERGIPVWQFDHTVNALPKMHRLFHFQPKRIVSEGRSDHEVPFAALLTRFARRQLLLKMDIEGDEWKIFADLPPGSLGACRQVVVELHDFLSVSDPAWCGQARKALQLLAGGFAVVHVHGNNLSKRIVTGGLDLPDSLEVTFANRAHYSFEPTVETFPGREDRKNNPYFPDFRLGRFQFGRDGEML